MSILSIQALARLAGINSSYRSHAGEQVSASPEIIIALLGGMGLPAATSKQIRESYARLSKTSRATLPPLIVSRPDDASRVPLKMRGEAGVVEWRLTREDGSTTAGLARNQDCASTKFFQIPPQPQGYHVLEALGARAHLICAPARCWTPDCFNDGKKVWGVNAQVYALKSGEDFGIGGFNEIADLAKAVGERGASFLGLSPLHALFSADRGKCSPYSPSNRLMLEPLFIDPRAISSFAGGDAEALYETSDYQAQMARLRADRLIDYRRAWTLLRDVLEPAWTNFCEHRDNASFAAFKAEMGAPLADHALFEALCEQFSAQGLHGGDAWPLQYREANSPCVNAARRELAARVDFYAWLQWVADGQLRKAAKAATNAGMEIGLYRDLAAGADRSGSEIWREPGAFLPSISIGAPPDLFAPHGQNWGLPPLDPVRLEVEGLRVFRDLVRANMRYAGAIRIDHAFQLKRLYLTPNGAQAAAGAYVDYPFEGLLACLRIESHRAKALVIAEDLGTAPQGFTQSIAAYGLLSTQLLLFERDANGGFAPPQCYPRQALTSINTHDLPTLQGWRRGLDIDMRHCFFGLLDADADHAIRAHEARALDDALALERLLPEEPDALRMRNAVFRFLARTPALLLTLQADDIVNEAHQTNLPGADSGYPNWRRRMQNPIAGIVRPDGPLAKAAACMALEQRGLRLQQGALAGETPRATYRLQFNSDFTFDDAAQLAPYFATLGISHLYASPIYACAPGSPHGYDIIDYARINPILGGEDAFLRLSAALKRQNLKLILDIVPNHMSKSTDVRGENLMWLSTLELGRLSPCARVFDIDWGRRDADGKILLPCLKESLREALAQHKIHLRYEPERGAFFFNYETQRFPLRPHDYVDILNAALIAGADDALRTVTSPYSDGASSKFDYASDAIKSSLWAITSTHSETLQQINSILSSINAGIHPSIFLPQLLQRQFYRLAHWRTADSQLNVRRFFNVNTLAGVRVEDPYVFDMIHSHIFQLIDDGHVHGLRIDHIDGLANPSVYLQRLQNRVGPGFFIVAEKILGPREPLPDWQAAGTTGYDALNQLDGIFVARENESEFNTQYAKGHGDDRPVREQLKSIKIALLTTTFRTELDALVDISLRHAKNYDLTRQALADAWMGLIADLPVYRSYLASSNESRVFVTQLIASISLGPNIDRQAIKFIACLLMRPDNYADLQTRFEQLSGPVMAKSLEDTLFYRNARFIALNEVGADPERFGISVTDFHAENEKRLRHSPNSFIATQTHDAKRGEDLRARLLALSYIPHIWRELHESACSDTLAPDPDDQYFLLQNIIGAWPVDLATGEPLAPSVEFMTRINNFVIKALRESRRRSSWSNPDERYEKAAQEWTESLCAREEFLLCINARMGPLARAGFSIALARTALKFTIPGTPDLYQGCEGADFALVDPDNRRPVDFKARIENIATQQQSFSWRKQALTKTLLRDRLESPDLYAQGDYEPVPAPPNWVAYRRSYGGEALLVAARLNPFTPTPAPAWAFEDESWRNLLLSSALGSCYGACVSGDAIILKSKLHDI